MARVAVMVHTMAVFVTWKCNASVSTRKTTTKKSKASRVQPRKLAVTACHASDREGGTEDAGVELEGVSSFSSRVVTDPAGEVYTADYVSHQQERGQVRRARLHGLSGRNLSFSPAKISTIKEREIPIRRP